MSLPVERTDAPDFEREALLIASWEQKVPAEQADAPDFGREAGLVEPWEQKVPAFHAYCEESVAMDWRVVGCFGGGWVNEGNFGLACD